MLLFRAITNCYIWCIALLFLISCNYDDCKSITPSNISSRVVLEGVFDSIRWTQPKDSDAFITISAISKATGKELYRTEQALTLPLVVELSLKADEYIFLSWIDYRSRNTGLSPYNKQNLKAVTLQNTNASALEKMAYAASIHASVGRQKADTIRMPFFCVVATYSVILTNFTNSSINSHIGSQAVLQVFDYYPIAYDVQTLRCVSVANFFRIPYTPQAISSDSTILISDAMLTDRERTAGISGSLIVGDKQNNVRWGMPQLHISPLSAGKHTKIYLSENDLQDNLSSLIINNVFDGEYTIWAYSE